MIACCHAIASEHGRPWPDDWAWRTRPTRATAMPINAATIAQMEKELADARDQLLREDGERYRILIRDTSGEEEQRILDGLIERGLKLHTARIHKGETTKAAST
jgi:hypothetical protein